jgi:hypothetical protein
MGMASVKCIGLAAAAVGASAVAHAQWPPAAEFELKPSPLESFAARPAAFVAWSKPVGEIDGEYDKATFTALTIADRAGGTGMRGVRIDLAHKVPREVCDYKYTAWNIMCRRSNAAVYIEEDRLEEVRAGVARGAARLRPWQFISSYTGQNIQGQSRTGIILCGYDFPGLQPHELAALFARAIEDLKAAPR